MKNYFFAFLIFIFFALFALFIYTQRQANIVLNLITPSVIQIDMNNNGIADINETVCIENIEIFSSELGSKVPDFANGLNISDTDGIALGYLTKEFASNLLLDKKVKVNFTGKTSHDCRFAEITVDNENYADKLFESGLAAKNGKFRKNNLLKKLEEAKKLNPVILNRKSYKYHKLDCKYGVLSSDYVIIPAKQLPKEAKACKFCHAKKPSKKAAPAKQHDKSPDIFGKTFSHGDLKLILTDFTTTLTPNKNCNAKVCTEIVNEINSANSSIDIAAYGLDKIPAFYNALSNARKRNVKIRLVYDKSSNPDRDYYKETIETAKISDKSTTDYLPDNAAYSNQLMHNKFIIIDRKTVITGSMNFTATGFSGFNANSVLIINSADAADLYTAEFEQMLSGKFHNLKQKCRGNNRFILNNSKIKILFSPYDKAMQYVIPLINDAEKYVYVPAFLITHSDFADALIKAHKRGADVKIIIDANSTSTRNTKHQVLRQNGIRLKTENYAGKMHMKSIIIDDKYFIAGSMNFSNSGENKNDENMVIVENPALAKKFKEYFLYIWQKIPDIYLKQNARAESPESIGSCNDGVDNDFDGLIDSADPACKYY